jgi:hypothetical protein
MATAWDFFEGRAQDQQIPSMAVWSDLPDIVARTCSVVGHQAPRWPEGPPTMSPNVVTPVSPIVHGNQHPN